MMQFAIGLPSSVPDTVITRMLWQYDDVRSGLHFWLSDNFRPDNVLFRIERIINEMHGIAAHDGASRHPVIVPFISLARHPFETLKELVLSALLHFFWFTHVVLGAGDRAIREYHGTTPSEIVRRLQLLLEFLNVPLSETERTSPLTGVPFSMFTDLQVPKDKLTILTAVQGKKMVQASLGKADYLIYNGKPQRAPHVMDILTDSEKARGTRIGCYLMCHFLDGRSSWQKETVQRSLKTFHSIVGTILNEMDGQDVRNRSLTSVPLNDEGINKVAFQGTASQFLELVDELGSIGVTYFVIGGPATWQDRTLLELLNSV